MRMTGSSIKTLLSLFCASTTFPGTFSNENRLLTLNQAKISLDELLEAVSVLPIGLSRTEAQRMFLVLTGKSGLGATLDKEKKLDGGADGRSDDGKSGGMSGSSGLGVATMQGVGGVGLNLAK
jgi:hypothetical protein